MTDVRVECSWHTCRTHVRQLTDIHHVIPSHHSPYTHPSLFGFIPIFIAGVNQLPTHIDYSCTPICLKMDTARIGHAHDTCAQIENGEVLTG
jgi:hypothetical protein